MKNIKVIAFGGKSGSGKSTCAQVVVNHLGGSVKRATREPLVLASKHPISAPVKEIAEKLFMWTGDKTTYFLPRVPDKQPVVDQTRGRGLLQAVGVKMREINPDVWINLAIQGMKNRAWARTEGAASLGAADPLNIFVIDDLRFKNEAAKLREVFGARAFLVRVVAPGSEAIDHVSEVDLDDFRDWNRLIENNGTLAELHNQVAEMLGHYVTL